MPENRERGETIAVRVTKQEREAIEQRASELNVNISTLVRLLASGEVKVIITGDKEKAK